VPHYPMTIDGAPVSDAEFPVVNPATGAPFAQAPDCSSEQPVVRFIRLRIWSVGSGMVVRIRRRRR
jgi:hypothetical protein